MTIRIIIADCRAALRDLPDESVHCCVTSPPYYGLRDYGVDGQLGIEKTPDAYMTEMVNVFREVRRVLRLDGTLWLNIGDSYAGGGRGGNPEESPYRKQATNTGSVMGVTKERWPVPDRVKPKDLIGIPWLLAFALRADGWWLRQDIIWSKTSVMPESVTDRCTRSHEYLFMLTRSARYFYDAGAIAEVAIYGTEGRKARAKEHHKAMPTSERNGIRPSVPRGGFDGKTNELPGREAFRAITEMRNKRSVWTVGPEPFSDAHFATYPPALIEPCILAGCPEGGTVLDPFGGSGTTGMVADRLKRDAILIELNPVYADMAKRRITEDAPLFVDFAVD